MIAMNAEKIAALAEKREIKKYCKRRAAKARKLLKAYNPEDVRTSTMDCLTDLLHLCHQARWDWDDLYERARGHFNAEVMGGEHG